MARIQSRMLNDNGNVRFDYAGVIRVVRHRFGFGKFIKADMLGTQRFNGYMIWPGWLPVCEKYSDFDLCVLITTVKNANSIMTHQWSTITGANWRDITVGDHPTFVSSTLIHIYHFS